MFLNNDLGLGMGLSFIGLSVIIRLLFFKVNLRNFKNMQITKLIYSEKNQATLKLNELQVYNITII
jgi:membrane protein insertase Oxa1/YidC/SpoIIIJ